MREPWTSFETHASNVELRSSNSIAKRCSSARAARTALAGSRTSVLAMLADDLPQPFHGRAVADHQLLAIASRLAPCGKSIETAYCVVTRP